MAGAARSKRDWVGINRPVIAKFRKDGLRTSGRSPLLLLTTTGARTGRERVTPLNFSRDGDRYIVIRARRATAPDRRLPDAGKLCPVIDREYALIVAADAVRHVGSGQARAKVVINVS